MTILEQCKGMQKAMLVHIKECPTCRKEFFDKVGDFVGEK